MAEVWKLKFFKNKIFIENFHCQLWSQRITAGAEQSGLQLHEFIDGLHKSDIQLNRKVLSELAAWEPATFSSLAEIAIDVKEKENK